MALGEGLLEDDYISVSPQRQSTRDTSTDSSLRLRLGG